MHDADAFDRNAEHLVADLSQLHDLDAFVAQDSSESSARALAGVSAATGLLPAPSASMQNLGTVASAAAAAGVFDDVPSFGATAAAPAAAPAASPAASAASAADPFDALGLGGLGAPAAPPAAAPVQAPAPVAAAPATGDLDALLAGL